MEANMHVHKELVNIMCFYMLLSINNMLLELPVFYKKSFSWPILVLFVNSPLTHLMCQKIGPHEVNNILMI